jgi:hypothetical protein
MLYIHIYTLYNDVLIKHILFLGQGGTNFSTWRLPQNTHRHKKGPVRLFHLKGGRTPPSLSQYLPYLPTECLLLLIEDAVGVNWPQSITRKPISVYISLFWGRLDLGGSNFFGMISWKDGHPLWHLNNESSLAISHKIEPIIINNKKTNKCVYFINWGVGLDLGRGSNFSVRFHEKMPLFCHFNNESPPFHFSQNWPPDQ